MRRFALLSPDDLGVVRERSFGRRGALVFATAESDGVIAYHPTRRVFELIEAAIGDSFLDPLDKAPITLPAAEKIFIGQRTLSLSPESAPSLGDLNILVMPVVEPGQAYNEPNLAPVWNFLDGGYFERARQFYEENSFNQLHLKFHMFGHTKGPAGLPLALPAPISTYYWPPSRLAASCSRVPCRRRARPSPSSAGRASRCACSREPAHEIRSTSRCVSPRRSSAPRMTPSR